VSKYTATLGKLCK